MEPIPGESAAKREALEKNIQELLQLKEQVTLKRRQLKAMGINDEPELKSKLIKYPDLQAKYKQQKQAKAAEPTPKPEPPTVKHVVPIDSPFIDPHAKAPKAPKAPEPVSVKAPEPVPVKAPVPAPPRPVRISHDGKWF